MDHSVFADLLLAAGVGGSTPAGCPVVGEHATHCGDTTGTVGGHRPPSYRTLPHHPVPFEDDRRRMVRGVHVPVVQDLGLVPAITHLAGRQISNSRRLTKQVELLASTCEASRAGRLRWRLDGALKLLLTLDSLGGPNGRPARSPFCRLRRHRRQRRRRISSSRVPNIDQPEGSKWSSHITNPLFRRIWYAQYVLDPRTTMLYAGEESRPFPWGGICAAADL